MKVLRDTWLVFERYLTVLLRNPAWMIIGVLQPVLYLVLFAPLLKSLASTRGFPSGGAYNVFVPGLLIQLGLDPSNITYDVVFNRLLDIMLASINFVNMLAFVGAAFYVATLMVRSTRSVNKSLRPARISLASPLVMFGL